MDWFIAGIVFGFVGSVHCIGMCGPLAMSLPGAGTQRLRYMGERLIYNLGRTVTYTLLGGLFGALGLLVALAGYQQWLSLGIGAIMVLSVLVPWVQRRVGQLEQGAGSYMRYVIGPIQSLYKRGGAWAMLGVGVLNGFLPCGFVYAALAVAVTAGSVYTSMAFMAAFGLGTLPAMFAVSVMNRIVSAAWRARLQKFIPVGVLIVGLLLIWRGLSLGVMLSPDLHGTSLMPDM